MPAKKTIYTIGHSTHAMEDFIRMLQAFDIEVLVDIRRFPGSRNYPAYNKESLAISLDKEGIRYIHLQELGGRRPVQPGSKNTRWRNKSFQGYADYMERVPFQKAIRQLEGIAAEQITVYMCSEAVWWRCHRSMVSDYLKAKGWTVLHILSANKADEHPYTAPAQIANGQVSYKEKNLFSEE
ncbi:DUF488 domain-containing protein [Sphingobacterium suaedae]|uniref:DUF488 family protein n=1 Tax=Sphingobacterium suaedae TaxID=1686402 RepID=A0ABW5KHL1_9SPHI